MSDWLNNEVITGLQKLYSLRLQNTPAEDALPATAMVWIEVLQHMPVVWDQKQDEQRLRRAFATLMRLCDRWPVPKQLIEHLGSRPQAPPGLPPPPIPESVRAKRRAELKKLLLELAANKEM